MVSGNGNSHTILFCQYARVRKINGLSNAARPLNFVLFDPFSPSRLEL